MIACVHTHDSYAFLDMKLLANQNILIGLSAILKAIFSFLSSLKKKTLTARMNDCMRIHTQLSSTLIRYDMITVGSHLESHIQFSEFSMKAPPDLFEAFEDKFQNNSSDPLNKLSTFRK